MLKAAEMESLRESAEAAAREQAESSLNVDVEERIEWFIRYLKEQNLGRICNAHRAWADQSPQKVRHRK